MDIFHYTLGPEGEVCQFGSGSGSGSATRPLQIDLNLPPWAGMLADLLADHKNIDSLFRHVIESPAQPFMEAINARDDIFEKVGALLNDIDSRLRQVVGDLDQERARQPAEQMAPLAQTEAQPDQFDAQRRADEEAVTSPQRQLWAAQKEFLKDAGEGSTSAPVDKGARDRN